MPLKRFRITLEQVAIWAGIETVVKREGLLRRALLEGGVGEGSLRLLVLETKYVACQIERFELLRKGKRTPPSLRGRIRRLEREPELRNFVKSFKEAMNSERLAYTRKEQELIQSTPTGLMSLPLQKVRHYTQIDYAPHLNIIEKVIRESNVQPEAVRIADVGCGIGNVSLEVACKFPVKVFGFDREIKLLDRADENKQALSGELEGEITFELCNVAKNIPGKYDIVMCNHLIDRTLFAHNVAENIVKCLEGPIRTVIITTGYKEVPEQKERIVKEFTKHGFSVIHVEWGVSLIYSSFDQHIFVFRRG